MIPYRSPLKNTFFFVTFIFLFIPSVHAQECLSELIIKLKNMNGSVFGGQKVTLTKRADGQTFSATSDSKGEAKFKVPCDVLYDIEISNYTRKKEVQSAKSPGGMIMRTFTYEKDMAAKEKAFAMNTEEQALVDKVAAGLPDTTLVTGSAMKEPLNPECFTRMEITLKDIENGPLANETLSLIGEKRHKNINGTTDRKGHLLIFLPKGDKYFVDFKYNKNFTFTECAYSKGSAKAEMNFSYLGTKEIERRKKEEALRIAAEAKRIKDAAEKFERECKKLGITVEEGRRREAAAMVLGGSQTKDTVVSAVLNRNKRWSEKLIVCDLTGSMSPYAAQLAVWYQLAYLKETNLQFVFFNDGDNMPDRSKKIGSTGGIYYSPSKGVDSLFKTIAHVASAGWGGDCPENNMEALIKGVKMAKPYKELVMIADNNAPVKDIELLKKFSAPVHIILCGVYNDMVLVDYMNIAWKTKGSIHTIEEDITNLAGLLEGQEIKIGKNIYRIMGGEFVRITKI
jgi:hypothetical protein